MIGHNSFKPFKRALFPCHPVEVSSSWTFSFNFVPICRMPAWYFLHLSKAINYINDVYCFINFFILIPLTHTIPLFCSWDFILFRRSFNMLINGVAPIPSSMSKCHIFCNFELVHHIRPINQDFWESAKSIWISSRKQTVLELLEEFWNLYVLITLFVQPQHLLLLWSQA